MFMLSLRVNRKIVVTTVVAVLLVLTLSIAGVRWSNREDAQPASSGEKKASTVKPQKIPVKDNAQRVAFIRSFGWDVEEEPVEVMEVVIPQEFDEVYQRYNSMQKMQGMDLEPHCGKRAKRYSYVIVNYPNASEEIRCNLLILGDRVIAGDVASTQLNGFMHGLVVE